MGNCYAGTSLFQNKVNLQDRNEVHQYFLEILEVDGDLTDNTDYFDVADDGGLLCESLGYENDAEMHVGEIIKDRELNTVQGFTECFKQVLNVLDKQEFWGECSSSILDNGDGTVTVAYVTGGSTD